jgi:hypothetical protein
MSVTPSSTADRVLPRYPVYIPSKGRWGDRAHTIRALTDDGVPFYVVVEDDQADEYADVAGRDRLLVLPERGRGLFQSRNWIKDHATAAGHARHWQLDDNIRGFCCWHKSKRMMVRAGIALRACEDFTDRYTNIAISGLNYDTFVVNPQKPFVANCHVYSITLVNNAIPHRWRLLYNDDTDMCLQVLSDGWCTVLLNAFSAKKCRTMSVRGGNTDDLYQGDGRLKMARALERVWPYVVEVDRRFDRPQHVINWSRFTTPLQLRDDVDLAALAANPQDYGMRLVAVRDPRSGYAPVTSD